MKKTYKFLRDILLATISGVYNMALSIIFYKTIKLYLSNHLTIGIDTLNRNRIIFPHPVGIVIGKKVKIGYDCIIYQNVTIGTKDTLNYKTAKYPSIENNVTIYANAVIFGDITIGNNSIIGAGAVVFRDVPAYCMAVGNPAQIMPLRRDSIIHESGLTYNTH